MKNLFQKRKKISKLMINANAHKIPVAARQ